MSLATKLALSLASTQTKSLDLATGQTPLKYTKTISLADGTGADQADLVWHDQRTLAASGTEDLDLAGALADAFGATLTFARVKGLIVAAAAGNTNNVEVGGHATAAWATWLGDATDVVSVRPGGLLALFAPDATAYAVTATTADLLTITNSSSGTGVTYDIVVIGASA